MPSFLPGYNDKSFPLSTDHALLLLVGIVNSYVAVRFTSVDDDRQHVRTWSYRVEVVILKPGEGAILLCLYQFSFWRTCGIGCVLCVGKSLVNQSLNYSFLQRAFAFLI